MNKIRHLAVEPFFIAAVLISLVGCSENVSSYSQEEIADFCTQEDPASNVFSTGEECYIQGGENAKSVLALFDLKNGWAEKKCSSKNEGEKYSFFYNPGKYTRGYVHLICSDGRWDSVEDTEYLCEDSEIGDICIGEDEGSPWGTESGGAQYIYTSSGFVKTSIEKKCASDVFGAFWNRNVFSLIVLDSDTDNPKYKFYGCTEPGFCDSGDEECLRKMEENKKVEWSCDVENGERCYLSNVLELTSDGKLDTTNAFAAKLNKIEPEKECSISNDGDNVTVIDTPWTYVNGQAMLRLSYLHCIDEEWTVTETCFVPDKECSDANQGEVQNTECVEGSFGSSNMMSRFVICNENRWERFREWPEDAPYTRAEFEEECRNENSVCVMGYDPVNADSSDIHVYRYETTGQVFNNSDTTMWREFVCGEAEEGLDFTATITVDGSQEEVGFSCVAGKWTRIWTRIRNDLEVLGKR